MGETSQTSVRRLRVGDEPILRLLADRDPQTALLADERTVFVAAFEGERPVGFAFGYVLERRHGEPKIFFVYEVDVDPAYRRQGIATRMFDEMHRYAREQGAKESFVLTEQDNDAANALYASLGGERVDAVMWDLSTERSGYRPATDDDVDLLVAWHADPQISRYWDDETFTREEILHRLHREAVDAYIVEDDGVPVGYLQAWWEPDPPKRGGIDGFLVPDARGRGVMPRVAHRLAHALLAEGWEYVTVDPYAWNERALRGWAKAGFVEVSRHGADDEHDHPWVLMRFASPG